MLTTYMQKANAIIWFRNDLRLTDNPAFFDALSSYAHIAPLFIYAPQEEGKWASGSASRWWLHHSLTALSESLAQMNMQLIIREGPTATTLRQIAQQTCAKAIFYNRRCEPWCRQQEQRVCDEFAQSDIKIICHNANLLFQPEYILSKGKTPFKVFTPFWNTLRALPEPEPPVPKPHSFSKLRILAKMATPKSLQIEDLELLPKIDWAVRIGKSWQPGEKGAKTALRKFLNVGLAKYSQNRDRPDLATVSRLSPHLHFGEISVRTIWHSVKQHSLLEAKTSTATEAYLRELVWREFAHYLLYYFPKTANNPLRKEFNNFPWSKNTTFLKAWQHGQTGYPIVDAGMRELWHTGWMHNRVRMIVASFLVKDLLIPWQVGAKWFWDTLVDADLANNTLGWQWTAGCGADAAPYFRIFNPVLQGEKFDPKGNYVRRWIPALQNLSTRWIHKPWLAPATELEAAGIILDDNYPRPIVDHSVARQRALSAFFSIKPTT
jgi:deoxyribodipyrimidine photo-lyase